MRAWSSKIGRSITRVLDEVGCARVLGLMRIATALMLWARFGGKLCFDGSMSMLGVGISCGFFIGSTLMCIGLWTRLSTAVTAIVLLYCHHIRGLVDSVPGWTNHNILLLILTVSLLALTPCGTTYSVDRWRALRRAAIANEAGPTELAPLWSLRLLALLLATVYFSTVYDKTTVAFLGGERLQAVFASHYTGSDYLEEPWEVFCMLSAIMVYVIEASLIFGLAVPRLRGPLMFAGATMHLAFYNAFRIGAFSTNMIMLYFAWLPTAPIRRVIDEVCGYGGEANDTTPSESGYSLSTRTLILRLAAILATLALASYAGLQRLTNTSKRDLRLPSVVLMQSSLEMRSKQLRTHPWSRAPWKRREYQYWRSK